jgi:hypothetical protein
MGGKDLLRGRGLTMSDWIEASDAEDSERVGEVILAGTFFDAAVDGLMSWLGDGSRLRETDWIAEESSEAGFEAMVVVRRPCRSSGKDRCLDRTFVMGVPALI